MEVRNNRHVGFVHASHLCVLCAATAVSHGFERVVGWRVVVSSCETTASLSRLKETLTTNRNLVKWAGLPVPALHCWTQTTLLCCLILYLPANGNASMNNIQLSLLSVVAHKLYTLLPHKQEHLPGVLLPQDPSEEIQPWNNAVSFYWAEALIVETVKYNKGKPAWVGSLQKFFTEKM